MKTVPWILFAFALFFILLQQMCRPKLQPSAAADFTAFEKKIKDTVIYYEQLQKASDAAIDEATAHAIQANEQLQVSKGELKKSYARIGNLLAQLDATDKEKPDCTWVSVSPNFKTGCDSLRAENKNLLTRAQGAERDNQQYVNLLGYEISIRDSTIAKERSFNAAFQATLHDCIAAGKQAQKVAQPRYQVYAGIAAWGNKINPLGGGEINLTLKTKLDQMYEVKGGMFINTWWIGAGTKIKLHF